LPVFVTTVIKIHTPAVLHADKTSLDAQ